MCSEQGLDAVLGHIVVGVLLYFVQQDVQQLGSGESVVAGWGATAGSWWVPAQDVEPVPDVLDQVHPVAVQGQIDVHEHLHVVVEQLQLLHDGSVNIDGQRVATLYSKIAHARV